MAAVTDDLRARILEALNTAPAAEIRDDAGDAARHASKPWRRHDQHHYDGCCALCRGEADTLADAVMAVLDEAIAQALHGYADRLDAIDPQCTALTGPAWYGQGWHEAANHLHDLADDHPGRMRREAGR